MTANDIQKLLKQKHAKDVYVPECKNGPTWFGTHLRLDGWAMRKSWTNPLVIGYEIKVSRSDFMQDDKYLAYRQYCDELYIVAPKGILFLEELPPDVGYMCPSSTGTRLYKKRKAVRREEPLPEELYRYILMSRVQIRDAVDFRPTGDGEWLRNWLEKKEVDRSLGRHISKTLSRTVKEKIFEVERENERLKSEIERLEPVKAVMEELGVSSRWNLVGSFRKAFDERINGERDELMAKINGAISCLNGLSEKIEGIEVDNGLDS